MWCRQQSLISYGVLLYFLENLSLDLSRTCFLRAGKDCCIEYASGKMETTLLIGGLSPQGGVSFSRKVAPLPLLPSKPPSLLLIILQTSRTVQEPSLPGGEADVVGDDNPLPMSLKQRLRGCFLLLLLGLAPCPVILHVAMFYPAMKDVVVLRFFIGFIYLCILPRLFGVMVGEARRSRLGTVLSAERVSVDDIATFVDQRSANMLIRILFKVGLLGWAPSLLASRGSLLRTNLTSVLSNEHR